MSLKIKYVNESIINVQLTVILILFFNRAKCQEEKTRQKELAKQEKKERERERKEEREKVGATKEEIDCTVCPGSSDPPENISQCICIRKIGLHRFLTITIF